MGSAERPRRSLPLLPLLLLLSPPTPCPARRAARFDPTWESLDARPLPAWFDQAKFGIFIHWGVFSVPSFGSEWFWWYWQKEKRPMFVNFMKDNYPPDFKYEDFGPLFTAKFFNANQWADLLQASGAKYVVLTSKHHEGFTLWGSKYSWNWNAVDEGPKRDIIRELEVAIRNRTDLRFGLYYSLFEWFHPLFLEDQSSSFHKQQFPVSKMLPEISELVNKYRPEVLWSDGDGGAPDSYWNSTGFLAWLYNDSPVRDTVVTNDRWGAGSICKHGGYYTCSDRYNPGHLLPHKWENCMTIDKFSWGYRRNARISDYLTIEELVKQLVETVSCGGNLLMNIGPTLDGTISAIFEERLRQMGAWLKVNGEAIYDSHTWRSQNDTITPDVWYTSKPKENLVYAIFLEWPTSGLLILGQPNATLGATKIKLLGHGQPLNWISSEQKGITVELPQLTVHQMPCHTGTSGAWNNWIGLNQYVNTPLEDVISNMSFEETMSCILRFLAQDAQYMDSLQQPQGTEAHGKGFLENSNPTQRSDPVMQKQPVASWDQNPEQSNKNHREEESQRAQSREGGGEGNGEEEVEKAEKEQEELEKDEKRENKAPGPKSRFVSKSLMTSLWEKFKVNKHPTVQDILSLSFQFNMTDKQIIKWFCEKRKKYKEMTKQKHIKKLKRKPVSTRSKQKNEHRSQSQRSTLPGRQQCQGTRQNPGTEIQAFPPIASWDEIHANHNSVEYWREQRLYLQREETAAVNGQQVAASSQLRNISYMHSSGVAAERSVLSLLRKV